MSLLRDLVNNTIGYPISAKLPGSFAEASLKHVVRRHIIRFTQHTYSSYRPYH